jgi:hypothetical protein
VRHYNLKHRLSVSTHVLHRPVEVTTLSGHLDLYEEVVWIGKWRLKLAA